MEVFGEHFFSLTDARSYVDPITNSALLSPIHLQTDLGNILQGQMPRRALPAFLHEGTHYWCFDSPVGIALALVSLRARRKLFAAFARGEHKPDVWDVVDDYVRYEVTINIYRALLEGMALFAEFDAAPGNAESFSQPTVWALVNFAKKELDETGNVSFFGPWIGTARMNDDFLERKANLLAHPLTCAGGGYLPGYLTIKLLWLRAASKGGLLTDRDFFLMYLRQYFFEDMGLVAHLLDPNTKDIGATERIEEHIANRITHFFQTDHDLPAQLLDKHVLTIKDRDQQAYARGEGRLSPTGVSEESSDLGWKRLLGALKELEEQAPVDRWERLLANQDAWRIAQRQLMCLGRLDVDVEVNEHRRVIVTRDNSRLLATQALDGVEANQKGTGSLQVHIGMTWRTMITSVSLGRKTVCLVSAGKVDPEHMEQYANYCLNQSHVEEEARAAHSVTAAFLKQSKETNLVLEANAESSTEMAERFFCGNALGLVSPTCKDGALELLRGEGFLSVLNSDTSLLRALALISMATPQLSREALAQIFELKRDYHQFEGSAEAAIQLLNEKAIATLGATLIEPWGDSYLCLV